MHAIRTLLSQLHNDLFDDLSDTDLSHITLNLTTQSISGLHRAGFENSFSLVTFAITPRRFMGSILVEAEGQYWSSPTLLTWNSHREYINLFLHHSPSETLGWSALVSPFKSAELVRLDEAMDAIEILNTSGESLTASQKEMSHLNGFD